MKWYPVRREYDLAQQGTKVGSPLYYEHTFGRREQPLSTGENRLFCHNLPGRNSYGGGCLWPRVSYVVVRCKGFSLRCYLTGECLGPQTVPFVC